MIDAANDYDWDDEPLDDEPAPPAIGEAAKARRQLARARKFGDDFGNNAACGQCGSVMFVVQRVHSHVRIVCANKRCGRFAAQGYGLGGIHATKQASVSPSMDQIRERLLVLRREAGLPCGEDYEGYK